MSLGDFGELRQQLLVLRQVPGLIELGPLDDALAVYDEDAPSVIAPFIVENAIGLSRPTVGPEVRQKRERQVPKAAGELVQGWSAVHRNPKDLRVLLLILFSFRTEGREFS